VYLKSAGLQLVDQVQCHQNRYIIAKTRIKIRNGVSALANEKSLSMKAVGGKEKCEYESES
jgi:hypothetical protein